MNRIFVLFSLFAVISFSSYVRAQEERAQEPLQEPMDEGQLAPEVECHLRSMIASSKKGGIDPKLDELKHELSKPPFSAFSSVTFLSSDTVSLVKGHSDVRTLPTKKLLRLRFKEAIAHSRRHIRMYLSIRDAHRLSFTTKTEFTLSDHGTLVLAGEPITHGKTSGSFLLAITCALK